MSFFIGASFQLFGYIFDWKWSYRKWTKSVNEIRLQAVGKMLIFQCRMFLQLRSYFLAVFCLRTHNIIIVAYPFQLQMRAETVFESLTFSEHFNFCLMHHLIIAIHGAWKRLQNSTAGLWERATTMQPQSILDGDFKTNSVRSLHWFVSFQQIPWMFLRAWWCMSQTSKFYKTT